MSEQSSETFRLPRTGLGFEAGELVVTARGGKIAERYPLEDVVDVDLSVRWNASRLFLALAGFFFTFIAPLLLGPEALKWLIVSIIALAVGLLTMREGRIAIALRHGEVRRVTRDPFDDCRRFVGKLKTMESNA